MTTKHFAYRVFTTNERLAQMENTKDCKVVIYVGGGNIQAVYANSNEIEVVIVDADNLGYKAADKEWGVLTKDLIPIDY